MFLMTWFSAEPQGFFFIIFFFTFRYCNENPKPTKKINNNAYGVKKSYIFIHFMKKKHLVQQKLKCLL